MQEKKIYKLKIDDEFKNLIPELTKEEQETVASTLISCIEKSKSVAAV